MRMLASLPLAICAFGYGAVTRLRNRLYDSGVLPSYRSKYPVISIGNLSVGGNAKTPLCIYVAKELERRGYKPVVLTRGYGGQLKGPVMVTSKLLSSEVGDEALMMSQDYGLRVVVARQRVDGARFVEEGQIGNVILLDDGFQHRALQRALDIVSVNVSNEQAIEEFLRGRVLPLGRFRESCCLGLERAHTVVFSERKPTQGGELDARLLELLPPHVRAFRSFVIPQGIVDQHNNRLLSKDVVAFAGIANPDGFFETLRSLKLNLLSTEVFSDHYSYSEADLVMLRHRYPDVPLVCTEKDAIKLARFNCQGIYVVKTQLEVRPADAFMVQIERALRP